MTTHQIIARLLELPAEIEAAEDRLAEAQHELQIDQERLLERQSALLYADEVKGSNEAARKAHLHQLTAEERNCVTDSERVVAFEKIRLTRRVNEFSAHRAVARLIARETE